MPVYNGERYLAECIESILYQTFHDFEFLIMDDGSTDGTSKILDKFAKKDSRIQLFHQKNSGIVDSLNALMNHAQADIIARMDADDKAEPERFAVQYTYLKHHTDTVLVGCFCKFIGMKTDTWNLREALCKDFFNRWFLSINTPFMHSTVMMRKDAIFKSGGYRKETYPAEDYDLWIRIKRLGKIVNINRFLMNYRISTESITGKNFERQLAMRHRLNLQNLEDIYQHNEIPSTRDIEKILDECTINYHQKYVIGKIACLTGCYLTKKAEPQKAMAFYKMALKYDKKRIDAFMNLHIFSKLGKALFISPDYSPIAKKLKLKLFWFHK